MQLSDFPTRKIVSVLGSAHPLPGSTAYQDAYQVGRALALQGYAVMTGGYGGVMAGASQGAAEAGGYVIGVTSAQIERFRPMRHNQWVQEQVHYETLRDRLFHLVKECHVAITLPGGIGTLSELALTWSLLQTGEIASKPLIAIGDKWANTIHAFLQFGEENIVPAHARLLQLAPDVPSALRLLSPASADSL